MVNHRRAVGALIAGGVAARLVLAATIGLGVDESYEVVVSRRFSLSFLDHPPLSFWMAHGMAWLAHSENRVLLRAPFILLFALTTWLLFRLTARLFGERAGWFAALLLNLAPVFSLAAGGWILPDGPLDFGIVACVLALSHVLTGSERDAPRSEWGWWLVAGAAAGVALLSKYHAAFLVLGVLAFLLTRRESRPWLRRPQPYMAAVIALAFLMPVLAWNASHGFASFRFQGGRAVPKHGNHVGALLQNLAGQAGYLTPWIWVALVLAIWRAARRGPRDAATWLLFCTGIGPVVVFTVVSLGGNPGLPHWPAPGYLLFLPLLGEMLANYEERGATERRRVRQAVVAASVVFVALASLAASDVATGWVSRLRPDWFRRGDPSLEALDWSGLRPVLASRGLLPREGEFVATTHWMDAAKVGYALGPDVPVLCLSDDPRHFQFLHAPEEFAGRNAILLVRTPSSGSAQALPAPVPGFDSLRLAARVPVLRAGVRVFDVSVYRAWRLRRTFAARAPN